MGDGHWEFRPFHRKIAGTPPSVAYSGLRWSWTARVWDPQASWQGVPVHYSSPTLPSWLSWKDDVLAGVPPTEAQDCEITAVAKVSMHAWIHSLHFHRFAKMTQSLSLTAKKDNSPTRFRYELPPSPPSIPPSLHGRRSAFHGVSRIRHWHQCPRGMIMSFITHFIGR